MMNPEFVFVARLPRATKCCSDALQDLNVTNWTDCAAGRRREVLWHGAVARLLLAESEQRMSELKTEPLLGVPGDADEQDVFELFDKYNLRMLTVTNSEGRPSDHYGG